MKVDSKNQPSAEDIARDVRTGEQSAVDVISECLADIKHLDKSLNSFTHVRDEPALKQAARIDAEVAAGNDPGPLAGVPFAVKNLFDIEGIPTLAGSLINADAPVASQHAVLIQRLEAAGAVLVGALNMGEYAYDFTGENVHYGACRNPWDTERMSGGSSSGSGSAVAARLVPLALGSDTNGSIRVPSSLCGTFGLKPTYGRLPRTGSFPFCDSLDHLGPLANNVKDLVTCYDSMQGWDAGDHACIERGREASAPSLSQGVDTLRVAMATGYFDTSEFPVAARAVKQVTDAFDGVTPIELNGAKEGRAAAYLITNSEGAALHRDRLGHRLEDFDPDTRDRFIAGSLLPANWYYQAQAVRAWWRKQMNAVFAQFDLIIAPCTPCPAPLLGTKTLEVGGKDIPLRPNLGLFTQPFSAIGLPVCSVPLRDTETNLPIGVQLVSAPWREDICLRAAYHLESIGLTLTSPPPCSST